MRKITAWIIALALVISAIHVFSWPALAEETVGVSAEFMLEPEVFVDITIATRDEKGRLLVRDKYATDGWFDWNRLEKIPLSEFMKRRHPDAKILKVIWKPNHGNDWLGEIFIIYQELK